MEYIEEVDKLKTRVLKYVLYKKRTEAEIREKFSDMDQDMLEEVIEQLKESGYISDSIYIKKAVDEFMRLRDISIYEISYKLANKGLKKDIIEEYISGNWDELYNYERSSVKKIIEKKNGNSKEEIKRFLMTKGYLIDIIEQELENY